MKTILIVVDVTGVVQLKITDDGKWSAPGDPNNVLGGILDGRHRFEPDDATGVYGPLNKDIFKLVGFRTSTVKKLDSAPAINEQGNVGSWTATDIFD